jgi:hypothetical protein
VTKSLGASTWATAAAIAGPVIYLIATLIGASVYKGSPIIAYVEAVVSVIGGVTIFTGVVAFLALYCRAQTLLILCASLYRALGGPLSPPSSSSSAAGAGSSETSRR